MNKFSKLLIAYDGSPCSESALNDLGRAGLPSVLDALVLTVSDVILPPSDDALPAGHPPAIRIPEVERHALAHAKNAFKEARAVAERGVKRVEADFPNWCVKAEVRCDSPAWAVVKMANRRNPSLIVVGSHEHTLVGGRLILGSVSLRVLHEARCSVRVARCSDERRSGPVRIVVGFNGSPDSDLAVAAVASRTWTEGSEVRVVMARATSGSPLPGRPAEILRAAGLNASEVSREGDPAAVLISVAEEWDADSIFVGTRDVHGFRHLLNGSVSSAVAARARCSVEVARATCLKVERR